MIITQTSGYKNSLSSLKKRHEERKRLDMILNHIERVKDRRELQSNPISHIYGFDPLIHDLKDKYSFNLNKSRGKIRLIFRFIDDNTVELLYISIDHYDDYKKVIKKGI